MIKLFSIQYVRCLLIIRCIIFYQQFDLTTAIVGPNVRDAEENEFPYVISIMRVTNSTDDRAESLHKCTGTLVSKQDVLTAEHCLRRTFSEGFKVMVGSINLAETTQIYPLFVLTYEHWILFRRREIRYRHQDIAFVKLLANVPPSIQCATVGNIDNNLLYGLHLRTAGWGKLGNNTIPRILQTAKLKVLSKRECEERYLMYEGVEVNMDPIRLCTVGDPYAVINKGDSGGPLLFFGALIAVNSGICPVVDGNIHPHQINLHTGIRYYQEFFGDVMTTFFMNY